MNMNIIKIYKDYPQEEILESDIKTCIFTDIKMSDGTHHYTADSFDLNNKFITVNTNKDKNVTLNTNYITSTRPGKFIKVPVINKNGELENHYYLVHELSEIEVVHDYQFNSNPEKYSFNYEIF